MQQLKQRESQFELLRIVAMAMIVALHFNGVVMQMFQPVSKCSFSGMWGAETLEAVAIVGVNLFVLISGYFGIRLSAKGIAKYVGWVLWYSILLFLLYSCWHPEFYTHKTSKLAFLGITHSTQWFVTAYFVLMALSPVLNAAIRRTSFSQHRWIALALIAVNCTVGWWLEVDFNKSGYTVYHLVMVYFFGHTLRECLERYRQLPWRWICAVVYMASVAGVVLMMQSMDYYKAIAYCNPVVLLESMAFFVVFATMHFRSRAVNWMASSAFAVYLIHMHFAVYPNVLRPALLSLYASQSEVMFTVWATLMAIVLYAVCILVDKPRAWLFDRIIEKCTKEKTV